MSAPESWPDWTRELSADLRNLRANVSDAMKAFGALAQTASAAGTLDVKTKELIATAISVAVRCDDCIAFHVREAVNAGATKEEIAETLAMAIYMGAGPSAMYASHAWDAYAQFAAAKAAKG